MTIGATFRDFDKMAAVVSARAEIIRILEANPSGISEAKLKAHFGVQALLPVLNELLQQNRLNTVQLPEGGVMCELISEDVATKMDGLSAEVMLVYHVVKAAGTNAVSSAELKNKTKMQQTSLGKATKELEKRNLIKRVKSIHQKTQKLWMLFHLQPSTYISGGPWYTDNEFDDEFVNEICKIAFTQIKEAWTQQGRPSSLQEVHRRVLASGVSQEPLELGHLEQVLRRLVFDCRVEEVNLPAEQKLLKNLSEVGPYFSACADLEMAEIGLDGFTSVPCGVCPVFHKCQPGGVVSPEACVYLEQWWGSYEEMDGSQGGAAAEAAAAAAAGGGEEGGGGGGAEGADSSSSLAEWGSSSSGVPAPVSSSAASSSSAKLAGRETALANLGMAPAAAIEDIFY